MYPSNRLPLILAITLHVLLFLILFWQFASPLSPSLQLQPDVDIIKAVAVNPTEVQRVTHIHAASLPKPQPAQEVATKPTQDVQQPAIAAPAQQAQQQAQQQAAQAAQQKAEQQAQQKQQQAQQKQQQAQQKLAQQEQEKQQAAALQQQQASIAAQEKKLAEQKAKQEQLKKQQQAKKEAEKKQQQKAAQELKLAQQKELDNQIAAEQKQLEAARTNQQQSEIEKYLALIQESLRPNWNVPDGVDPSLSCQITIHLGPDGTVLSAVITRSSGNVALDNSARTAVFKSSPLPIPSDPALVKQFRELNLTVSPKDMQ